MKDRITLEIAGALNISRDMARLWRNRWLELSQKDIPVGERLADAERPGGPMSFSLEQILQLFAIACEPPEDYGRPISHWTQARTCFGDGQTGGCQHDFASACGAQACRSRSQTAPVRVLVKPPPTHSSMKKSKISVTRI